MEPDKRTFLDLSTFVFSRLALKGNLPDKEAASTTFNALSFNETTISKTEALNLVAATSRELIKTMTELGNNMQRLLIIILIIIDNNMPRPNRGIMRSRGNSNNNNYGGQNRPHHFLTSRTRIEEVTCFVTAVDNQDTKIMTADFDCYQNVGETSRSADTASKN